MDGLDLLGGLLGMGVSSPIGMAGSAPAGTAPTMPLGSGMFGLNGGDVPPVAATTSFDPKKLVGLLNLGKSIMGDGKAQAAAPAAMPMMGRMGGGAISFMPQSGITMPYTTGSQGLQAMLQKMRNTPFGG